MVIGLINAFVITLWAILLLSYFEPLYAQNFNMFKDYSKAAVKPNRYSKNSGRHDVSEYLTKRQKAMMVQRNGPTTDLNSFSNKWSGFDKQGSPAVNRRLRGGQPEEQQPIIEPSAN